MSWCPGFRFYLAFSFCEDNLDFPYFVRLSPILLIVLHDFDFPYSNHYCHKNWVHVAYEMLLYTTICMFYQSVFYFYTLYIERARLSWRGALSISGSNTTSAFPSHSPFYRLRCSSLVGLFWPSSRARTWCRAS